MTQQAYCVKCKHKRDIKNPKEEPTPRGAIRVFGTCEKCGTKVTTFRSSKTKSKAGGKSRSRSRSRKRR